MSNSFEKLVKDLEEKGLEAEQLLISLIKEKCKTYGEASAFIRNVKAIAYWNNNKSMLSFIENVEKIIDEEKNSLPMK